jgi:hypothetical protein
MYINKIYVDRVAMALSLADAATAIRRPTQHASAERSEHLPLNSSAYCLTRYGRDRPGGRANR